MRLNWLKPHYFRAFGDNPSIVFAQNLTIFYGGNGSGKSSLAETIEWLFYGYTKRRRKGDDYSKTEYKGSYINKGCPDGVLPYVEAEVIFQDNSIHTLKRTMSLDERGRVIDTESHLFIDGAEVSDFSTLGISSDAQCPVVVQHGIQDFIHTRPIDRYRIISEALGLADLTKFKDVLEQAKNRYKNNPPQKVTEAKQVLKRSIQALENTGLNGIVQRWRKGDVQESEDNQAIFIRAKELTGSQAENIDELLKDVKNRQALEISKLFDIEPYRSSPNQDNLITKIANIFTTLSEEQAKVLVAAGSLAGSVAQRYSEMQVVFWRQGLAILEQQGIDGTPLETQLFECPFCGEKTLSAHIFDEIRLRTLGGQHIEEQRRRLTENVETMLKAVGDLETIIPQIEFQIVSEEKLQILKKMFARDEKRLNDFVGDNKGCIEKIRCLKDKLNEFRIQLSSLQSKSLSPEEALKFVEPLGLTIQNANGLIPDIKDALNKYLKTLTDFQPILQRELSDEKTVAIFTSLIELLSAKRQVDLVIQAKGFDADILKCQQISDAYILEQQKTIVGIREKDILAWYGLLSPNADVKFSGLEPGKNEFNLKATAFGRELNAAASLSQSQLNCLGLSVYIPSIVAPDAPFEFIVFDDPVQAMDDEHHEAFLLQVMPELVGNRNRQTIVLTHLKYTADRLRNLNYDRIPLYYRFDKLTSDGPKLKEHIIFKDEIDQIRYLSEGGEDDRKLAVDRIRVLCEIIMREAHLKIAGTAMPSNLQNPKQMSQTFHKLPGVSIGNAKNLEDTIDWSDPSHHTDVAWQVPDESGIRLHLERLQSIITAVGIRPNKE